MGPLLLVSLLGVGMLAASMASDDGQTSEEEPVETSEDPEIQDEPETGDESQDTGATVGLVDNVITIDVGDDETGTVVGIRTESEIFLDPPCCSGGTSYSVDFYLVPEGVDFPPSVADVLAANPELVTDDVTPTYLDMADYHANIGLDPIASYDLGSEGVIGGSESGNPYTTTPEDTYWDDRISNLEISSNTEIELIRFRPDGDNFSDNDILALDEITGPTDVIHSNWPIDEVLEATESNSAVYGGLGNDTLSSYGGQNVSLSGGSGDDVITFQANGHDGTTAGSVYGGSGNDTIDVFGTGGNIFGNDGDDVISAQGDVGGLWGGSGDDTLSSDSADYGGGTPLYGEAGDDLLIVTNSPAYQIGVVADGGLGNDTIQTQTFLDSSTSYDTLTGGEGDDRFELSFWNARFDGAVNDVGVVTTITDFTPGQDVLVLSDAFDSVDGGTVPAITSVDLIEATDGSYTDVVFEVAEDTGSQTMIATVRLTGTSGVNASDIVLAA